MRYALLPILACTLLAADDAGWRKVEQTTLSDAQVQEIITRFAAKEALIKSMDAGGADTLNDDYRLAQGLLAETVGLTGIAHDLFVHVEPPEHASVREQSSYRIAQNHLKALPPTP